MGILVKIGIWWCCYCVFGEAAWLGWRCVGKETMMPMTSSLSAWKERRRDSPSSRPRAAFYACDSRLRTSCCKLHPKAYSDSTMEHTNKL